MHFVETERLNLRTPTVADLEDYLDYRNFPEDGSSQNPEPADPDAAESFLLEQQRNAEDGSGWKMLAIEPKLRFHGRLVIGEVGVFLPTPWTGSGDVGWWLHPQARSLGFATEAAEGLLRWCFETLGLHRVTAACLACNERSLRVMGKIGMRIEARRSESKMVAGRWLDEVECALLSREWNATGRGG